MRLYTPLYDYIIYAGGGGNGCRGPNLGECSAGTRLCELLVDLPLVAHVVPKEPDPDSIIDAQQWHINNRKRTLEEIYYCCL